MDERKPTSNLNSMMQNPYQPPAAPIPPTAASMVTPPGNGLFVAGLVCALLAAVVPMLVVPAFEEVFKSFGADLPLLTLAVLRYHPATWFLPMLVIAARLFWPLARRRAMAAGLIGVAGAVFVFLGLGIALYWPIFRLGAVV